MRKGRFTQSGTRADIDEARMVAQRVGSPLPLTGVGVTGAGAAAAGDLFNPAGPGVDFVTRTGRVKASWVASGIADAGTTDVLFQLQIGISLFQIDGCTSGDGAHTVLGTGVAARAGFTPGSTVNVRVTWNAGAGTFAPSRGELVIEDV